MTREDLMQLAVRLTQSPVPTLQKKVYGYQGHITPLLEALPPAITIDTWVTTACHNSPLPTQVERIPAYLRECLTAHIQHLQTSRATSIVVLREAVLLARYRVPLAFFYDLTGDAHAIILHFAAGSRPKGWTLPSYVHYDLEAPATYLAQALGDQFIRDDQGERGAVKLAPLRRRSRGGGSAAMTLARLQELIRLKERPETTLSLETAIQQREQTVARYRFTPSIRDYFAEILSLATSDRGQGYWVQAEYGAGKTHFLATLAVLLSDRKGIDWSKVRDNEVKGFAAALQKARFFPIVLNCKGRLATEGQHPFPATASAEGAQLNGRPSLQRILEQAIQESLTRVGLHKRVTVSTTDEIQAWWQQAPQGVKSDLSHYVQSHYQGRPTPDELLEKRGPEAFAKAMIEAAEAIRIAIPFTKDIRSRFLHIYRQLTRDEGYHGLLVIVDEFKSWQDLHPPGSQGFAEDEHVLETLAFHLPVDDHARIVTVVASQAPPPAKLMGGARGDRFKLISLFAGEHSAWEYDAIVADVVRDVQPDRLPEVNAYYDYYYRNYSFLKQTKREYFQQIFPFQPRCFEVIRNITKRELATTRSSIHYVYEVLEKAQNLSRQGLIKVADFLDSPNLINDLQTAVYHEAYQAYQGALGALTDLFDDTQDLQMARDVLKTLFLWHCAFKETPRGMTANDLAEACLTDHEFFKKEDYVEFILGRLRDNQVIEYLTKERGAFFRMSTVEGPNPVQILARIQRTQVQDPEAKQHWETLLTASAQQAGGLKMLFQSAEVDRPQRVTTRAHKVRYDGERVVINGWRLVWGNPVVDKTDYGLHFRIVCLRDQADVDPTTLHDDRIAVVIPGKWEDTARDVSRRYTALVKMKTEYQDRQGPDAEDIRRFVDEELKKAIGAIVLAQKQLYRAGRVGRRVDGLARMNQIEELGGGVAAELSIQYKNLLARCDAKALPEELPEVKGHPIFRGITLSTAAPEQDVTDFERRLEEALQVRLWQLADETIAAILKTRDSTPLQALLEAIQAADTLRLAEHFTGEVANLVRQVLRDARLVTVDVCLADYDGPAQLGDDPKEIDEVVAAFRSFLTRNIAVARQANPGKTVRLNLKAG